MTKNLYIVGAGGFAREIYSYIKGNDFIIDNYELSGFLDDKADALQAFSLNHDVVAPLLFSGLPRGSKLLLAIANPDLKEQVYTFYSELNFDFITFIHSSSFVGSSVLLGEGTIVAPQCTITADVSIGKCSTINAHSSVGHDVKIGDYCTLSGHCDVTGSVELGDKVFMGSHALVIPCVKVGNSAKIGAGSVVISRVKAGLTVFGNPAKKIK